MKRYVDKCRPLALAAGLVVGVGGWAQTVTVATNANVTIVDDGVGTPPAGQIAYGGVVCMKDPDINGTTFTINGVVGTPVWTFLGDISKGTTNVPPAAGVYTHSGTSCVIETYNKTVRTPAEVTLPEVVTHARSKGQVRITYSTADGCGGVFIFDILKKWGNPATTTNSDNYAPQIVGPNCWGTGLANFQVDQVSSDNPLDAIGFDQYYWTFTNGANATLGSAAFYTSADRSAIVINQSAPTFTTWLAGGGPYTIKCCFGRCNPWDGGADNDVVQNTVGVTCVTKTISPACPSPIFTGGFPTCINAITPGLPTTITPNNYSASCTYTWTRSNLAWTIAPAANGGVTISSITDANPCTFFLSLGSAACGNTVYTYTVNRNYNAPAILAAPGPYCVNPGIYAVPLAPNAQGNQTCWGTLPGGWTAANLVGNPSSVVFSIPASAAGTTNTINLFSCACPGVVLPVVINVRPATPTWAVAPPTCVDLGTAYNFQVNTPGTFTWTHPNWSGPLTGNPVSLTPQAGFGAVTVTRDGQPNCASLPLSVTPAQKPVVTQPCIVSGMATTGNSFSCAPGNASSAWVFGAGLAQATALNVTGNPAVIPFLGNAGTYPCQVTTNGCTQTFNVVVPVIPSVTPTDYTTNVNPQAGSTTVSVDFVVGNLYRLWNCGTGLPVTGWLNNQSSWQLINPGAGSYTIEVDTPPLNCGYFHSPCVTTGHSFLAPESGSDTAPPSTTEVIVKRGPSVIVSPNPNNGRFDVNILRDLQEGSTTLYDPQGRRMARPVRITPGHNTMDLGNLKPGVYTLRTEMDGELDTQTVVITD